MILFLPCLATSMGPYFLPKSSQSFFAECSRLFEIGSQPVSRLYYVPMYFIMFAAKRSQLNLPLSPLLMLLFLFPSLPNLHHPITNLSSLKILLLSLIFRSSNPL